MLTIVFLLLTVPGYSVVCTTNSTIKYTSKYDEVDVALILVNPRLYKSFFECLINKKRCSPDGTALKKILPELVTTACGKCTEKQKEGGKRLLKYMLTNKPKDYEELEKLYGPQGILRNLIASPIDQTI